jgi:hypothetical protein
MKRPPEAACWCERGPRLKSHVACATCLREMGVAEVVSQWGGVRASFTRVGDPSHRHESRRAEFVEVRR